MHRAVYAARPDVGAVLHCSPFFTTLVASSAIPVDPYATTDSVYYVGEVGRVGFELPGTADLAAAVAAAIPPVDVLLLENHGCCVRRCDARRGDQPRRGGRGAVPYAGRRSAGVSDCGGWRSTMWRGCADKGTAERT